jgi:hypothetical protein
LVARPILLTSTTIILGALIIHCLFFFLFLFFDPASRPAYLAERESLGQLFDANSYDLCAVCVLYWYVNWHLFYCPFFLFVLFFHCDSEFGAPCTRVVNIIYVSGNWLFSQWLHNSFETSVKLISEILLDQSIF